VKNIFVGNLDFAATDSSVRAMFEQYGTVDRVNLVTDRHTGRSRGFAFVEMSNTEEADRAITALATLTAPEARVMRDGIQQVIPAAQVVVGDLLVLAEGDIVPADATVVQAAALLVDEAALTGESVPVDKSAGLDREVPGGVVSAGTVVVRGRGRAVVTATGTASAMGRIAALMATGSGLTPLQRRLVGVGKALAIVAVVLMQWLDAEI